MAPAKPKLPPKILRILNDLDKETIKALTNVAGSSYVDGIIAADKSLQMATSFDLASKEAIEYAKEYKTELIDRGGNKCTLPKEIDADTGKVLSYKREFVPWMTDYSSAERQKVGDTIGQMIEQGISPQKAAQQVEDIFTERARHAEMVVRTESRKVQTEGTMNRFDSHGVKQWQWSTAGSDVCPDCLERDGKIYDLDSDEEQPPLHPGCRCVASAYVDFEAKLRELAGEEELVSNAGVFRRVYDFIRNGGPGSGNFGHTGRPGEVGGSGSGGGSSSNPTIHQNLSSTMEKDYYSPEEFTKDGYTKEQSNSLIYYKEDGYSNIRDAITGKTPMTSELKSHIENLDNAIDRSPIPAESVLYHGMGNREAAVLKALSPEQLTGKKFETTGYISSTQNTEVAHNYAEGKAVMVITTKEGGKGVYYKDPDNEDEVVLARGAKYRFDKVSEDNGIRYYHVSQVVKK